MCVCCVLWLTCSVTITIVKPICAAGAIVGFFAGAVIGPTKDIGYCNGARMGAFSGAILAVEMLQATVGHGRWSLVSPNRKKFYSNRDRQNFVRGRTNLTNSDGNQREILTYSLDS